MTGASIAIKYISLLYFRIGQIQTSKMEKLAPQVSVRDSESFRIQQMQEICSCKMGMKVRFFCTTVGCQIHKSNIFFCDECYDKVNQRDQNHKQRLITKLLETLKEKWMELNAKVGKMEKDITACYLKKKEIIEYLESQIEQQQPSFQGKRIHKDYSEFKQFFDNFGELNKQIEDLMTAENTKKLLEYDFKYNEIVQKIDGKFKYLLDIGKEEFVYKNYMTLVQMAPTPLRLTKAREKVLQMKLKLGKQQLSDATSKAIKAPEPQQLSHEFASLQHKFNALEVKFNSFLSLFGDNETAVDFMNTMLNYRITQQQENDKLRLQQKNLKEHIDELKETYDLKIALNRLQQKKTKAIIIADILQLQDSVINIMEDPKIVRKPQEIQEKEEQKKILINKQKQQHEKVKKLTSEKLALQKAIQKVKRASQIQE
ncbi:hypothetical protein FGO68_gene7633 [Halteria grandinella]|uniref:Uncharacterized protein n=1 Tax=Halteria grandinella TaxID=5974 RepID=A0A8J8T1K0_HALGN|nr:hypothetical protein FGO68_gene7633 [Halteria grandinella]